MASYDTAALNAVFDDLRAWAAEHPESASWLLRLLRVLRDALQAEVTP